MAAAFWLLICALIGQAGGRREIGAWPAFLISAFLTPVIGLIIVAISPRIKHTTAIWRQFYNEAERLSFKDRHSDALDKYQDALFELIKYSKRPGISRNDAKILRENEHKLRAKIESMKSKALH